MKRISILCLAVIALQSLTGCVSTGRRAPEPVPQSTAADRSDRPRDTVFGIDKLQHFLMTGYVEAVAFGGLRGAGADRSAAYAGGIAAAAAASVAKEIYDRKSYGLFSFGDLVWDTLGAAAAMLILLRTH